MERHSAIEPSVGNRAWFQGGCCREQPITDDSGLALWQWWAIQDQAPVACLFRVKNQDPQSGLGPFLGLFVLIIVILSLVLW
jgi:hypothetical protein